MELEQGSSLQFILKLSLGYLIRYGSSSSKTFYHLRVNFKDDFQRFKKDEKVQFLLQLLGSCMKHFQTLRYDIIDVCVSMKFSIKP